MVIVVAFLEQSLNVNSLVAHNFSKLCQLEAYNTINYDFICISETYLDSSVMYSNEKIQLDGYSVIRSDPPSDSKRGGVCLYYKGFFLMKIRTFN